MITHQDNGLRSIVMSKTIITVHHTESEHHLNGHAGAWGNWPLTKKGHQQAFEIGKWLLTEGCDDGYKIADLDLDDTSSYGPETTTIYNPIEGEYVFYVYNWTGSPDIKTSGATVKVYNGNSNEPAYVFSVPLTGDGRYWTVFKYNSKTRRVTPVNIVSASVQNN